MKKRTVALTGMLILTAAIAFGQEHPDWMVGNWTQIRLEMMVIDGTGVTEIFESNENTAVKFGEDGLMSRDGSDARVPWRVEYLDDRPLLFVYWEDLDTTLGHYVFVRSETHVWAVGGYVEPGLPPVSILVVYERTD